MIDPLGRADRRGSRTNQGPIGGREEESNPVAVRAELETPLPRLLPRQPAGTRSL